MNAKNSNGGRLIPTDRPDLYETGCRPKEARTVVAKHFVGDWKKFGCDSWFWWARSRMDARSLSR